MKCQVRAALLAFALLCAASAHASQFATGGEEAVVPGTGDVTHTFTESGTFTLSQAATVRLLVVGGGGGGGRDCAAGGGGGGVISVDSVVLPAGSYTVTVGAGGAGGTSGAGSIGGATTIEDAGGNLLYKALGGGGGVGWSGNTPVSTDAAPFASGGGGTNGKAGSTAGDPTQGNNGAKGTGNGPQGGGGAGGPSVAADNNKDGDSPAGGPGFESDIRGAFESFGAGGGGGSYGSKNAWYALPGPGGDGIAGYGVPEPCYPTTDYAAYRCQGRDGYGGGGGGGNNMVSNGARGGSGCAIFRLSNVDPSDAAPALAADAALVSATPFDAVLSVTLASPGAGQASASVFLQVAENASDLADAAEIPAAARADGVFRAQAAGLRPAHAYAARFVVRNAADEEDATAAFAFSTAPLAERTVVVPSSSAYAGLWQYHTSGSGLAFDFDETTAGLVEAPGATMAAAGAQGYRAFHGTSWTDGNGTTWTWSGRYGYVGQMWMEAGVPYNFFEQIWDSAGVEIDGTALLSDSSSYVASFATYTPQTTGWHPVKIRLGGGSGNLGVHGSWYYGVGWNAGGEVRPWAAPDCLWPGPGWNLFENTNAVALFVRETPWRDVAISSYAPSAGGIDFSVALGASGCGATELHCVWGATYGAEDPAAWTHNLTVGMKSDAAQTATYSLAGTTGSPLVRFYALHSDGTTTWSGTAKIDLENVSISDLGVDHDGDEGTFGVRVGGVGSGAFSLALQLATDSGFSNATNVPIAAAAAGDYSTTLPLTPGTVYWYRYVATDGSSSDTTPTATFTTAAGADLSDATIASAVRHTVTFRATLDDFGAGATTLVTLWYSDSADSLTNSGVTATISSSGDLSFVTTIPGATRTIYYKLVASNEARRGTSWTDETPVASVVLNETGVVYTWKKDVAEGDWEDPANWTPNVSTNDCNGWPAMGSVDAYFPAGTDARIHVSGYYAVHVRINPSGTQNVDTHVTLVGDGPDVSGFDCGDTYGGTMNRTVFSFENMRVSEKDIWDYQIGSETSSNAVFRIAEETTVLQGSNKEAILGTNTCFVVESGAVQDCTFLLLLRSYGEGLRIDDGVCRLGSIAVATPAAGVCPQSLRIRGAGGLLEVKNGIFGDLVGESGHKSSLFKTDLPLLGDFDVVFEPVGGGYTNTVSYSAGGETVTEAVALVSTADSGRAMGKMLLDESVGKIRLSVDVASMRGSFKGAKQHFVLWKGGIDTNSVELVQGDKYALSYTYGWPSVNDEPENVDDLPTGVWAEVSGTGGFILIIQ